jgi:hypothetical protein
LEIIMNDDRKNMDPSADIQITAPDGGRVDQPKRIRLNTRADLAKELRRIYREARSGELPVLDAERLVQVLSLLMVAIEDPAETQDTRQTGPRRKGRTPPVD